MTQVGKHVTLGMTKTHENDFHMDPRCLLLPQAFPVFLDKNMRMHLDIRAALSWGWGWSGSVTHCAPEHGSAATCD